jgi:Uma2 family endonuclease
MKDTPRRRGSAENNGGQMGALEKPWTLDEFIAWEERQERRYEYDGIATYAMTGGTRAHAAIQANLLRLLGNQLKGKPCRPYGSDLKLKLETSVRYPDAFVECSPGDMKSREATKPVVIFEILSESTARQDLGVKNIEYQATPSVRRYVVLHQTAMAAEVFFRKEDGEWTHEFVTDAKLLDMPEIGVAIPLLDIYEDVGLSP